MADDDAEDRQLLVDALAELKKPLDFRFVRDGEELIDYLRRRGEYEKAGTAPRPDLILLDLKMPRMDGLEALREIKSNADLRSIPVVALTTSTMEDDIGRCYALGVNSFITKPVSFVQWINTVEILCRYWFETVQLPPHGLSVKNTMRIS
ncbi:MAG: response regulator [Thermoguttaceae bacterium]